MIAVLQAFLDRRLKPRLPTWIDGKVFPGELDCILDDISSDGARVQCRDSGDLADRIVIVDWTSGEAFDCAVMWRQGAQAGVHFVRRCTLTAPAPAPFHQAREAWIASRLT